MIPQGKCHSAMTQKGLECPGLWFGHGKMLRAVCANPSSAFPGQYRVRSLQDCIAEEKMSPATKAGLSLLAPKLGLHPATITSSPPSPLWTPLKHLPSVITSLAEFPSRFCPESGPPEGHISLGTEPSPAAPQADDPREGDTQVLTRLNTP